MSDDRALVLGRIRPTISRRKPSERFFVPHSRLRIRTVSSSPRSTLDALHAHSLMFIGVRPHHAKRTNVAIQLNRGPVFRGLSGRVARRAGLVAGMAPCCDAFPSAAAPPLPVS